jgi:hypothetical protein
LTWTFSSVRWSSAREQAASSAGATKGLEASLAGRWRGTCRAGVCQRLRRPVGDDCSVTGGYPSR